MVARFVAWRDGVYMDIPHANLGSEMMIISCAFGECAPYAVSQLVV
jgi:hypothetical protein